MAKDFYSIVELTQEFERSAAAVGTMEPAKRNMVMLAHQAMIQLAIAQQLSVISGHLGKLVELCEKQSSA